MTDQSAPQTAANPVFERKVGRSAVALFVERLWPRLWLVIAIAALFILISLAGLWPLLAQSLHRAIVSAFALGLIGAILYLARTPYPSRAEAIRRLELHSNVPHRPASSYEDTLSATASDPATATLWQAHRERLRDLMGRLSVKPPVPRTDRHDPWALRAALLVAVAAAAGLVGDSARDRIAGAFRFGASGASSEARLDAWIAPPAYTGRPPLMLADGAHPGASLAPSALAGADGKPIAVPEHSVIVARTSGAALAIELTPTDMRATGAKTLQLTSAAPKLAGDLSEVKAEIKAPGQLVITRDGAEVGQWRLDVIRDNPPTIALTKDPEINPRGAMKLSYLVADDYGVVSAGVKLEKLPPKAGDPARAWARLEPVKGPRPPRERIPALSLRLPRANAKSGEAQTHIELGSHPWSGLPVRMTLEAKDASGQIGRSESREMILPGRRFEKPFARAVVEQRRILMDDSRRRPEVLRALKALTLAPEEFFPDTRVYLGLRDALHRLERGHARATLTSVTAQLWHVALRIEDGDLSDAERALREAQDKLAKALEEGASDKQIESLMKDLKQALSRYMDQLNRQAENGDQQQSPPGQDEQNQSLSSQDLDKMMKNIEDMAKNGSREQAQQMLSEMRDLLDRLQNGKQSAEQQRQGQEMLKKMDELGNIVGDQQKLMDETYAEDKKQDDGKRTPQQGPNGQQQGQNGPQGRSTPGEGSQGEAQGKQGQGSRGQGQAKPGQQGQRGQKGQPGQKGAAQQGSLGDRQGALRDQLDKLQREMGEMGLGSDKLDAARDAMEGAAKSLKENDFEQATEDQGRALDNMRQGAQSMAQEIMKSMPKRFGQSGDTPRDPLGRPQKSQGPDLGTSVKVPDEIDMQRAREILEELRKRSGEPTRPLGELDYLERLLKRF